MTLRHTNARALGAAVFAVILTAPLHGTSTDRYTSHLTFGGAVALPHVTLQAGTYVFERIFAGAPDVVVVRSLDGRTVYFMAPTLPTVRPRSLAANQVVTFGEARRGLPRPIAAWYPAGADLGYAFVY